MLHTWVDTQLKSQQFQKLNQYNGTQKLSSPPARLARAWLLWLPRTQDLSTKGPGPHSVGGSRSGQKNVPESAPSLEPQYQQSSSVYKPQITHLHLGSLYYCIYIYMWISCLIMQTTFSDRCKKLCIKQYLPLAPALCVETLSGSGGSYLGTCSAQHQLSSPTPSWVTQVSAAQPANRTPTNVFANNVVSLCMYCFMTL